MKKLLAVACGSALLVLSSACGSPSGTSSVEITSSGAEVAAKPAGSAELTKDNFVERLAAAQREAGSAHMEMTSAMSGAEMVMKGDISIGESVADTATQMSMDMGAMAMEVRLVGGVMYMKMGEMSGGKYIKVDLLDEDSPLTKQYGSLTAQMDPAEQLETFRSALVEFENEGAAGELDGVETTKLRLVLDTKKALGGQADMAESSGAKLPKQIEYVLRVGSDDLMRQMTMDLAGNSSTINWSRWGEPVEVTAPPKSQITDMGDFLPPGSPAIGG